MDTRILLRICILFLTGSLLSFQYPVINGMLTSTFGEPRGDHLHDGIDMVSASDLVYPVADGKILYMWNKDLFPFDQYTGSGNYTFIAHNGDLVSVYLHLEDQASFDEKCDPETPIARYSNTGRSYGSHIHLGIYDRISWSSYNYLNYVSPADTEPPVIGGLAFVIDGKLMRISDKSKVRLTKNHPVYVEIHDGSGHGESYGIYKLIINVNNKNKQNITFDQINYEKNKLTVSGKSYDDIYCKDGLYKADDILYIQGPNTISVHAEDYNGNTATKEFVIDVSLDM